ncbi:MAG: hypothetical protein CMC05_12685 [Flavobacteriaceae bacterium]|nr:hypothetical protein [Flavobacteriaceae bacterium]MBD10594.1 hypothetical protein [Flavobacteriaceae bacterium]|tara:strand:- start:9072 stop:9668 length:597 start_codon:yes stop_codon:yes gene_type:complete
MKNYISILFLLLASYSFSQDFSYGIGGGPTVSTIAKVPFNNSTATQGELGFFIYGYGEYHFSEKMSIHGRLGIDDRVVRAVFPAENFLNLNYLSLMPSLKMDMGGEKPDLGAFFKPGLRVSYLLSAENIDDNIDLEEGFSPLNLGFNFGIGADFAKHFSFEMLFDFGITSEVKDSNTKNRLNSVMFLAEINIESLLKK